MFSRIVLALHALFSLYALGLARLSLISFNLNFLHMSIGLFESPRLNLTMQDYRLALIRQGSLRKLSTLGNASRVNLITLYLIRLRI